MGDFVQKSITKSATRVLATPIEDVTAFAAIVNGVVTNNPFGRTSYQSGSETLPAVEKTRDAYTARIVYENGEAQTVSTVSAKCPTVAAYTANVATVLADAALASAMGGTAAYAADSDSFSAALRCHDANGEVYTVTIGREAVSFSSYSDDAVLTAVETWATPCPRSPERRTLTPSGIDQGRRDWSGPPGQQSRWMGPGWPHF